MLHNSIGYHPTENMLYGTRDAKVVRIFEDGRTEDVVPVEVDWSSLPVGGTFDDEGYYWTVRIVIYMGNPKHYLSKVDLRAGSERYGEVVEKRETNSVKEAKAFNDLAFTPGSSGYLYALARGLKSQKTAVLYRLKLAAGVKAWEKVYETELDKPFTDWGGMMGDSEGSVYGIQSDSGDIYKFPVNDRNGVEFLRSMSGKIVKDMARCHNAPAVA
ncbi:hypothetical protein NLG97_g202 [Lecanicillium saksenae]|uniref:Uncharacterized protein n=1 Tax=Lecanicillium saksenae TaxID=468837 RepID=A0ACC1RAP7_9HYPO|nr:hypothetical protein NLG97_g202 [Lecanicillium saksenae]